MLYSNMMIYLNVTHLFIWLTFTEFLLSAWWLSDKDSTCRCRRYGFNPWVGKILWRRKWQPTSVYLPGKSHGQRSQASYSPWGHKKSDMTLWLKTTNNSLVWLAKIPFIQLHVNFWVGVEELGRIMAEIKFCCWFL